MQTCWTDIAGERRPSCRPGGFFRLLEGEVGLESKGSEEQQTVEGAFEPPNLWDTLHHHPPLKC